LMTFLTSRFSTTIFAETLGIGFLFDKEIS
jgi:hypothetical protein